MSVVVALVDASGRVVGNEYINSRKALKHSLNVVLFKKMMTFGFIAPTTTKSPEGESKMLL